MAKLLGGLAGRLQRATALESSGSIQRQGLGFRGLAFRGLGFT